MIDADAGVDLNYGPVQDLQLTATLPLSFSHYKDQSWRGGSGDVESGQNSASSTMKMAGFSAADVSAGASSHLFTRRRRKGPVS